MKVLRVIRVAVLLLVLLLAPLGSIQAQETNGSAKTVFQAGGAMSPALHVPRQQAIEEALAHNPAIAVVREQVAEAKTGCSIATAISG
jgi:outer membrane protein TolC